MEKKHSKIFYTTGLISLVFLPILFYLTTVENREGAINYGSIEIRVTIGDGEAPPKDSLYVLQRRNNQLESYIFEQFLISHKNGLPSGKPDWQKIYRINLPDSCKYGSVIQYIDILQRNNFLCGITANTIKFVYYPNKFREPQVVRLTTKQEIEYIYKNSKSIISSLRQRLSGKPPIRIMKYSDESWPPLWLGDFVYYSNYVFEEEPKSAILFREIGLWFLPILIGWCVLLYLGVQRK